MPKMIDIAEYLNKHIPYSLRIMFAHQEFLNKYHTCINDSQVLEAVFVGSLAKGRMLLEAIGVKLNILGTDINENFSKNEKAKDVCATDLNGKLVKIQEFKKSSPEDYENIKHFLIAANKYELHLTEQEIERDLNRYNNAIPIILKLIDEHIYQMPNNALMRIDLINNGKLPIRNKITVN